MLRVGVIMGGDSSEREVSLLSGAEFIKHLDQTKYEVIPIDIQKPKEVLAWVDKIDFALLALHGRNGEDGKVQALLEALEIPYSGSGVASSAICIDKNMSKLVMRSVGLKTPAWVMVRKDFEIHKDYLEGLKYPVIIKPNQGGSSIGISTADSFDEAIVGIKEAMKYDDEVIVEEWLQGDEITCSMMKGEIIPVLSVKPNMTFYDYDSKYKANDHVQKVVRLDDLLVDRLKAIGRKCWNLFKLKAYARIDMIITGEDINIIEINTLPGMTPFSHLPKSAKAMGISYGELLDRIIAESVEE